jgi:ketosteroid isomerase-like protein
MSKINSALILLSFFTAGAAGQSRDELDVRAVASTFGKALAVGDSSAAIALLHPDVVIFEGGGWESLEDYRKAHLRADMRFLQGLTQETLREVVTISGDIALVTRSSSTKGTSGERTVDSIGAETMVLLRTPSGWKIRHILWSSRRRPSSGELLPAPRD